MKKVFFYYASANSECLLYDFGLTVGDSLGGGCFGFSPCTIVTSIDSILVGSNYRKKFNLSSASYSIIEGIGSTSGLLEPLCPFEYSGTLICFTQNGQTLFPDTTTSCEIITHINEIKYLSAFTIFPNPFYTFTTLQVSIEFVNSEVIIYDTYGKIVKQQMIHDKTVIINRNGLGNGIYFFKVIGNSRQMVCGKFIIE